MRRAYVPYPRIVAVFGRSARNEDDTRGDRPDRLFRLRTGADDLLSNDHRIVWMA
jgi:hypothetical protein